MRGAVDSLVERFWARAFAVAGRLGRSVPESWQPVGHGTVLVVSPHPDDETLGCGVACSYGTGAAKTASWSSK